MIEIATADDRPNVRAATRTTERGAVAGIAAIDTTGIGDDIGADIVPSPSNGIVEDYQRRLEARRSALAVHERRHVAFSRLRLAIVAAAAGVLVAGGLAAAIWLIPLALAFAVTAGLHARLLNRRDEAASAVAFYERSLARVAGHWVGQGRDGERYLPPAHLYARDLDLFGRGGLFELLSTARTADGEGMLARWLLHAAAPEDIRPRQDAIRELAPLIDLREQAAVLGDTVRRHVHTSRLRAWADAPIVLQGRGVRAALPVLVASTLLSIVLFVLTRRFEVVPLAFVVAQCAIGLWFKGRAHAVTHDVDEASGELTVLAGLLALLERQTFRSPLLRELRHTIAGRPRPASREIARLSQWVALLSSRENIIFGPLAALLMWTTQWAFAIEAWRARHRTDLLRWLEAVGTFEALLSLATFASEHPDYVFPIFVDGPAQLSATGIAHPVLPPGAVTNDISLGGDGPRAMVVSGSNMSGKSTLLRTVGLNVILAHTGAPVRATAFRLSALVVGAAIQIQDSLADNRSRFFAEIQRIKQIVDLVTSTGGHALFLLDEILGGTNSHDRRTGAEAIITSLVGAGAVGLVTTHDLAIGEIADRMAPSLVNVHFVDEFRGGTLTFDYQLRPGIVASSNAIALMRSIGLEV